MRYLNKFLNLKCAPDVLGTVGALGNKAAKEITESMGIIQAIRKIVLKKPMRYVLYDLCAGNALTSVLAVHLLPVKHAYAIDTRTRDRNWHHAQRFSYIKESIYNKPKWIDTSSPGIMISVHACKTLSERVIEIYKTTPEIKHLALIPCCIKSNMEEEFPPVILKKLGRYISWSWYLAQQANGTLREDKHIQSPCRAIVEANKNEQMVHI